MIPFEITDGTGRDLSAAVAVDPVPSSDGAALYRITVSSPQTKLRIAWREPMQGHISVWHPTCGRNRGLPQWFHAQKTDACFYRGAPVLATLRADGRTHCTAALSDCVVASVLGYCVDDFSETDTVVFFAELHGTPENYTALLRIDKTPVPLPEALETVWRWWNEGKKRFAPLPDEAFAPLYSSWYSFHQTPDQAALTEELQEAAKLGFRTAILDDGWQIEGEGTKDYLKSGDWTPAPDKFPDFKGFVRDVHACGIKLILWFAVPFAGFETKAFQRFRDRLLYKEEGYINAGTLDVRYPEVREYIVGTYLRFIDDYDIDGLKLDFIDNFRETPDTPPHNGLMDAETVTEGVRKLLREICGAAVRRKPDFLFEFRQFYVGPEILHYANMLRVCDCAFDAVTNRIGMADLRMLTSDVAVHSDMLLWSPEETAENCALQLLNVMFAAVQISVRLKNASEEQKRLIKAHLAYREENRDLLLKSRLNVRHPEENYTALWTESENKRRRITVLYAGYVIVADCPEEDVFNATAFKTAVIANDAGKTLDITVFNCFLEPVRQFFSADAAVKVNVPAGGMIRIRFDK